MSGLYLGVDVGGTSVKAAALRDGTWLGTGQSHAYARPDAAELRTAMAEAVRSAGVTADDVLTAIGLCVPGLLDEHRELVTLAVNVPGLVGLALNRLVPEALGREGALPVVISNDAAAAAYHLYRSRALAGRLLVLALGTGVGAAVLDDGVPLNVEGSSPGHLGQIDVSIPGQPVIAPDGGAGGLEGYIGAAALRTRYGDDLVAALARFTGDEPAVAALVRALRIAHAVYRPHHVCLVGGIGLGLTKLLPEIRRRVDDHLTSLARPGWTLSTGDDGLHAARGAAMLAAEQHPA